jgi:hypothetical protein
MTISTVKADLNSIASIIAGSSQVRDKAKAQLLAARNQLAAIPATYAATIAEIDGYAPTGAFETLSKDEKAKLATEFLALKTAIETELTALEISFS